LGRKEVDSARFAGKYGLQKSWERGPFWRVDVARLLRLQPGSRRYAMWLTLFCVVISISLGLALGAMVVDSDEENARP